MRFYALAGDYLGGGQVVKDRGSSVKLTGFQSWLLHELAEQSGHVA